MSAEIITSATLTKEAKAFRPNKRLGQHFLVDIEALHKIVKALDARPDDTVIEVGPGIGFLTRFVCKTGAKTIGVDLDRLSIERLNAQNLPNLEILHGDILQFDLNRLDFFRKKGEEATVVQTPPTSRIKVVGNVPYQITGMIIGHLLGELDKPSPWIQRIDTIVLTVQYEVAQRIVAQAGESEYSRVSLLVQQYCRPEIVAVIPPESFFPAPQVSSAVIKLTPHAKPKVTARNMTLMRQLIQAGFRQRRKMYRNALTFLRIPQNQIDAVFSKLGLDPQVRAERLSLAQFAMLADALDELTINAQAEDISSSED